MPQSHFRLQVENKCSAFYAVCCVPASALSKNGGPQVAPTVWKHHCREAIECDHIVIPQQGMGNIMLCANINFEVMLWCKHVGACNLFAERGSWHSQSELEVQMFFSCDIITLRRDDDHECIKLLERHREILVVQCGLVGVQLPHVSGNEVTTALVATARSVVALVALVPTTALPISNILHSAQLPF